MRQPGLVDASKASQQRSFSIREERRHCDIELLETHGTPSIALQALSF
jgi:hypothetical protein